MGEKRGQGIPACLPGLHQLAWVVMPRWSSAPLGAALGPAKPSLFVDAVESITRGWHYVAAALTIFIAAVASGHAVLNKRDSRAAVLWIGVIWLMPGVGAILYLLLGVNRIYRKASTLRGRIGRFDSGATAGADAADLTCGCFSGDLSAYDSLAALIGRVVAKPLLRGNRVEILRDGDEAFPVMLKAIAEARTSISLATYIFDNDALGRRFAEALHEARARGVEVRVLIDAAGARYSFPSIFWRLRRLKVRAAKFMPTVIPSRIMAVNLRNHRKLMIVDGRIGFTGGMNLRQGNILKESPAHPVQDVHFRMEGPIVAHLQETFVDDWCFSTLETLRGEVWFPPLESKGTVIARGIADGPDEDHDKLQWTILGALDCARRSVRIVTPYFLPDQSMISALNLAAMRGIEVDIILPAQSNLRVVQWASTALLWQVLEHGCRIWLTPPPFDHSKIMLVDGCWSFIGSSNWDARSLRLNFEFNVECYDCELAASLDRLVRDKLTVARQLSLEEVDRRSLPVKLRDNGARLFTPYL